MPSLGCPAGVLWASCCSPRRGVNAARASVHASAGRDGLGAAAHTRQSQSRCRDDERKMLCAAVAAAVARCCCRCSPAAACKCFSSMVLFTVDANGQACRNGGKSLLAVAPADGVTVHVYEVDDDAGVQQAVQVRRAVAGACMHACMQRSGLPWPCTAPHES